MDGSDADQLIVWCTCFFLFEELDNAQKKATPGRSCVTNVTTIGMHGGHLTYFLITMPTLGLYHSLWCCAVHFSEAHGTAKAILPRVQKMNS